MVMRGEDGGGSVVVQERQGRESVVVVGGD